MPQSFKIMIVVTLALFTDGLFYGLLIPLLPFSPAQLSADWMYEILSASYALGVIMFTFLIGFLSDRFGRRVPMLLSVIIQFVALGIFAFSHHFVYLVIAKFAQGIAASTTWTSGLAFITDHFSMKRAQMLGYALLGNTIGLLIGPLLGGFFFEKFNYQFPFLILAGFMVCDLFCRFHWIKNTQIKETIPIKEIISLSKDKTILLSSAVIGMVAWCWCVLEPLYPIFLKNTASANPTQIGALFSISCLIYGISCPFIGAITDKFHPIKVMFVGLFLLALSIPILCLSKNLLNAGIALSFANIAYGFALNPTLSELSSVADRRNTGAYAVTYAIYNIAYSFGMFGSNLTNGLLAHYFSIPTTFFFVGGFIIFCLLMYLIWLNKPKILEFYVRRGASSN
ncbi:MFS transporter [Pigmentibacter sp. JX0631]|uniref:MFS transporter n=1 Tax=Pigmentibacter sp. JX0631 TaxID=2976982 RepID=UPI002469A9FD|nr:MFS transporter [Pigmentibacter sp. JX0631]WGL59111.1 MFS transporter [Pigmentibacter sp. JX0631]